MESISLATLLLTAVGALAGYYFGHKNGQAKGFFLAADNQVSILDGVFDENYTKHNENEISHMVYDIPWVNFRSLIPKPINQNLVIIKDADFVSLVKKAMAADRNAR
jgi:hypothetical protein